MLGCLARSVRDAARYFDVCAGYDALDPSSLPARPGWEAGLGTHDLRGRRVAVVPALGGVTLEPGVEEQLRESATALIAATGMIEVDRTIEVPNLAAQWMMGNLATLLAELGDRWPRVRGRPHRRGRRSGCRSRSRCTTSTPRRSPSASASRRTRRWPRRSTTSTSSSRPRTPAPRSPADSAMSSPSRELRRLGASRTGSPGSASAGVMGGVRLAAVGVPEAAVGVLDIASERFPDLVHMGALTIISNIYGNPAVSIPAGSSTGCRSGCRC